MGSDAPKDSTAGRSTPSARQVRTKFSQIVLVCTKCAKRQGLPKRAIRTMLKRELKTRRLDRRPRIVEVGCLGPCPKRALAVATSASLAQRRIFLIDPAATPEQAVDILLPETRPSDFGPKAQILADRADSS